MAAPSSLKYADYLNGNYVSKNSAIVRDEYKYIFNQFGNGLTMTDLIMATGEPDYVPANPLVAILRSSPIPVIKTGTEIAVGAAGAAISFTVHADSLDTNSKPTVREYETILIPKTYFATGTTRDKVYWISDITGTTVTAYPVDITADIDTAIPLGTELMIGATAFARGTLGTTPKNESYSTYTYYPHLIKEAKGIEGGALAHNTEIHKIGSDELMFSSLIYKAEFELEWQQEFVLLNGELRTQTNDVMDAVTSQYGSTNAILCTKGIIPTADDVAMEYSYSSALSFDDFDALDVLFETRGVNATAIKAMVGSQVVRDMRRSGLEFTREYSGGTDLYDKVNKRLGFALESVTWGNRTYAIMNPASLNNPAGVALRSTSGYQYQHPNLAIFLPYEDVTLKEYGGRPNASIPNVHFAYVSANGDDRSNVMKYVQGISNLTPGMFASSSVDGTSWHALKEFFVVIGGAERWIYAHKAA